MRRPARPELETRGEHELLGSLVACTYSDPWVEATGTFSFAGEHARVCLNTTVGWLIEHAEDVVRIAAEHTDDAQWRWVTTIPRVVVVKLELLEIRGGARDTAAATAARAQGGQAQGRGQARTARTAAGGRR